MSSAVIHAVVNASFSEQYVNATSDPLDPASCSPAARGPAAEGADRHMCAHCRVLLRVSLAVKHGGVGQREHQSAGFSLHQARAGRRAAARRSWGHFHHAEVCPGRRTPQLPLGLRESRGDPQRRHRGAGGLYFIYLSCRNSSSYLCIYWHSLIYRSPQSWAPLRSIHVISSTCSWFFLSGTNIWPADPCRL